MGRSIEVEEIKCNYMECLQEKVNINSLVQSHHTQSGKKAMEINIPCVLDDEE